MSSKMITFYQVLEIQPTATPAEIRTAFKRSVLRYHPDKAAALEKQQGVPLTPAQREANVRNFQQCVAAANCLLDPQSRARYDAVALGKQMVDITGRISETCSLKEDFEKSSEGDENGDDTDDGSEGILFTRECRCGGMFSVIWNPAMQEKDDGSDDVVGEKEKQQTTVKRKYSTCDSCSLVVEVLCDL